MPDEFFHRQPAHALDERALDLADVDGRVERAADVVQHVGAQQLPLAGQRVDDDLAHRRAVGEVEERAGPAASRGSSAGRAWRRSRRTRAARAPCRPAATSSRKAAASAPRRRSTSPLAKRTVAGVAAVMRSAAKAASRSRICRAASCAALPFRSAAGRRRGGRGVGDLLRVGRGARARARSRRRARARRPAPPWCSGPGPSRCRRG